MKARVLSIIRYLAVILPLTSLIFIPISCNRDGSGHFCTIGAACNDGNHLTFNDIYNADCECAGILLASCGDGIQNGNEEGVDCGGDCIPCPTCDDGKKNGEEEGVDCGGPECDPCPVADGDDQIYPTVRIGNRVWMAENLRATRFSNGDALPDVQSHEDWAVTAMPASSWYLNRANDNESYGRLYNWHAVNDARNICPVGWRVPADEDWADLVQQLGGRAVAGAAIKATGTLDEGTGLWKAPNKGADDRTGFSAVPAGCRNAEGGFLGRDYTAYFWSSTPYPEAQARSRNLNFHTTEVVRGIYDRRTGMSVRCVKQVESAP